MININPEETLTGNSNLVRTDFTNPPTNPLTMLTQWLEMAYELNINEPNGLLLSTVNHLNRPSNRVVLLKECSDSGIIFCSSGISAKGRDLEFNPWAAGTLWWRETLQQINFQGLVTKLSNSQSDELFQSRTREAQALTCISHQSATLMNETELKSGVIELTHSLEKIKRPAYWHGYYLTIESIEFWHGSKDRFHKRLRYDLFNGIWQHRRLQP